MTFSLLIGEKMSEQKALEFWKSIEPLEADATVGEVIPKLLTFINLAVPELEATEKELDRLRKEHAMMKETLSKISANTYGTETCNTEEENNAILARHFFRHQNMTRECLAKLDKKECRHENIRYIDQSYKLPDIKRCRDCGARLDNVGEK